MSRDDSETGEKLLNPYIKINIGVDGTDGASRGIGINTSTFEPCLGYIVPSFRDNGPTSPEAELGTKFYHIYGVVGKTVSGANGSWAYLNIAEPPVSRTLMGYLTDGVLKKHLPKIHETINPKQTYDFSNG